MLRKRGSIASMAAVAAVLGSQALSPAVTIQTADRDVSLQGTIVSFDGES